jgi:UDP-N-acetyl-2-amino-2-deoxyglucuronate dehydrogenase
MDEVRFALVGCGRIGDRHAKQINHYGTLVAVCDLSPSRAASLATQSVRRYESIESMLDIEAGNVDVVSVCTPNGLHAQHSIMALSAGCHVLCEKPLALSVHDCDEMIKASEKAQKELFIIKQNRFNPPVVAVKELIEEGTLGRIYSVQLNCFWNRNAEYYADDWHGTKLLDGGTLFTQFSHFIDLLYWYFGDVKSVKGIGKNYAHVGSIEFEDAGAVVLEFESGAIGTIAYTVNSHGGNMEGSLTIFGENGTVKIGGEYLNELEYQNIRNYKVEDLPEGSGANNYGKYQGSMSNHDRVYENVIDVLTSGGSMYTNAYEGLKTVEIIEKIYASFEAW